MKKKLITQSDDLIAQGVAKKLIRIATTSALMRPASRPRSTSWTRSARHLPTS
ncbi:MAG: hypothetical protein IKJ45_02995 [Kiritimatiellae bacterium]|nr:hypothetical protein [Kiritimatiellia bacterium]